MTTAPLDDVTAEYIALTVEALDGAAMSAQQRNMDHTSDGLGEAEAWLARIADRVVGTPIAIIIDSIWSQAARAAEDAWEINPYEMVSRIDIWRNGLNVLLSA